MNSRIDADKKKVSPSVSRYSVIKTRIYNSIFQNTLGRIDYCRTFAPGINIIGDSEKLMIKLIAKEKYLNNMQNTELPKFLDVGARREERKNYSNGYEYFPMDIKPGTKNVIVGDICKCPKIADNTFDVCFSMDVFEHLKEPWTAAGECIRITKPGGLLLHRTLFAYRYHPHPIDYWRFSSEGLEYLFNRSGKTKTILKGYDIRGRRRNHRGSNLKSKPPIDWLGGFRENWQVLWVGRKLPTN